MIILYHPRATRPRNRRLPLAVLALAAVLEGKEEYEIVDGNLEDDPTAVILQIISQHKVELIGVSAMPGPQMVTAMETSRAVRRLHPEIPICWGGYFASIYPDAALNARYVDFVVRGQGEDTLLELLDALRGNRVRSGWGISSERTHPMRVTVNREEEPRQRGTHGQGDENEIAVEPGAAHEYTA